MKFKLKNLRKYQNGGLTTFSPQPKNFTSPLQGIDPSVLRYNLNTAPLDTAPLIQVMQNKNMLDARRYEAELDRLSEIDKVQVRREEVEAEKTADWYKFIGDNFLNEKKVNKEATGSYLTGLDMLANSPKILNRYGNLNSLIEEKTAITAKILSSKPGDTTALVQAMNNMREIQNVANKVPNISKLRLDDFITNNLTGLMADEKNDTKVHRASFLDRENKRIGYSETEQGYTPGEPFNAVYSLKSETENYDRLVKDSQKANEVGNMFLDGKIIKEDTDAIYLSTEAAAENAANAAMSSPSQMYYMDEYHFGGQLYHLSDADKKRKIKEHFVQTFKSQKDQLDLLNKDTNGAYKGTLPKDEVTNKTTTIEYKSDRPGVSKVESTKDYLEGRGFDADTRNKIATGIAKLGVDSNDKYYVDKVIEAVANGAALDDAAINKIKSDGKAAKGTYIKGNLESHPYFSGKEEDRNTAAAFLSSPKLQDSFYKGFFYPNFVGSVFNGFKKSDLHPDLKGLTDNQMKAIIHHQGPSGGAYFLKNNKPLPELMKRNPNTDAEARAKIEKTGNGDFFDEIKKTEGNYDDVNQQFPAIGAYGIMYSIYKDQIKSFMRDNQGLLEKPDVADLSSAEPVINGVVIPEAILKSPGTRIVGNNLVVKGNNNALRDLFIKSQILSDSWGFTSIDELPGATYDEATNDVIIPLDKVKGTTEPNPGVPEPQPTPAQDSTINDLIKKRISK